MEERLFELQLQLIKMRKLLRDDVLKYPTGSSEISQLNEIADDIKKICNKISPLIIDMPYITEETIKNEEDDRLIKLEKMVYQLQEEINILRVQTNNRFSGYTMQQPVYTRQLPTFNGTIQSAYNTSGLSSHDMDSSQLNYRKNIFFKPVIDKGNLISIITQDLNLIKDSDPDLTDNQKYQLKEIADAINKIINKEDN